MCNFENSTIIGENIVYFVNSDVNIDWVIHDESNFGCKYSNPLYLYIEKNYDEVREITSFPYSKGLILSKILLEDGEEASKKSVDKSEKIFNNYLEDFIQSGKDTRSVKFPPACKVKFVDIHDIDNISLEELKIIITNTECKLNCDKERLIILTKKFVRFTDFFNSREMDSYLKTYIRTQETLSYFKKHFYDHFSSYDRVSLYEAIKEDRYLGYGTGKEGSNKKHHFNDDDEIGSRCMVIRNNVYTIVKMNKDLKTEKSSFEINSALDKPLLKKFSANDESHIYNYCLLKPDGTYRLDIYPPVSKEMITSEYIEEQVRYFEEMLKNNMRYEMTVFKVVLENNDKQLTFQVRNKYDNNSITVEHLTLKPKDLLIISPFFRVVNRQQKEVLLNNKRHVDYECLDFN